MYIYIGGWGNCTTGKFFWFLCERESEAEVFFEFCAPVPRPCPSLSNAIPMQNEKCKVQIKSRLSMQNDWQ